MKKILCVGDSLTLGVVGTSYIKYVKNKERFINKGINGDVLKGILRRTIEYLYDPLYEDVGAVIIYAGTNDLFYSDLSSIDTFKKDYDELIRIILEKEKRPILLGLSRIEGDAYLDNLAKKLNEIIEELSEKYKATFIDLREMMYEYMKENNIDDDLYFSFDGVHQLSFTSKLIAKEIDKLEL